MLKKSYKWLAVVLALSVLFSCLPMSVFALELSNDDSDVIIEDESQREESVKHFLMPDGSYKAVVYTQPVHRMDANGVWQDIDNRMDESTVKNKQAYVTSDGRTVFSKKISSKDATVFELTENGYSIKVSFADDGIKNTTAKLSNHAEKYKPTGADDIETQYKKLNMIDNNTTIAYRNLLKGMTLEYVLSGNDVKENIVIKRKADDYTYAFIYELENLFAELNEDGSIDLFDENSGDFVCEIPAPYMYDDDGAVSYDVSYALEDLGDGIYKLTVSADEEWINSSERAFPVVIDPTMTFDIDYKDTYINSSSPNTNYGGEDELWVSPSKITFLQFSDLPQLGDYVTVISAKIRLRYYYYVKTGSLTVGAYQVTENWNEHSLTWNTANAKTNMGISTTCQGTAVLTASESITEETPGLASIYITSLMESWIAGATNYGLAIKYEDGTNSSVILNSRETYTGAYCEISYTTSRTNYAPVDNGIYFFQNKQVNGYAQIDDNASTNAAGAILELREFDGASDQKWKLTYLHNDYYKITSVASGKAITAPSSEGNALTQETYQAKDTQMWEIRSAGNGAYYIQPKSNSNPSSNCYMVAGTGLDCAVELKGSQTDSRDKWKLHYYGSHNPLREVYGFSASNAALINMLYDKVDTAFPNETNLQRAWKCARLLGGIVYGNIESGAIDQLEWKNVAGQVFELSEGAEEGYFVNTLGYTKAQYDQLIGAVKQQHRDASDPDYAQYSDFAHYQIALAARLAYKLDMDGFISNLGTFCSDEVVSYLAGWLGDVTLGNKTMDNPDYCADLDAEISYRYIVMGCSASDVLSYYFFPIANSKNRAVLFLEYIPYDNVCQKVFNRLGLNKNNNAHWAKIQTDYPDTYDFLISLENGLETMGHFPD